MLGMQGCRDKQEKGRNGHLCSTFTVLIGSSKSSRAGKVAWSQDDDSPFSTDSQQVVLRPLYNILGRGRPQETLEVCTPCCNVQFCHYMASDQSLWDVRYAVDAILSKLPEFVCLEKVFRMSSSAVQYTLLLVPSCGNQSLPKGI